jgi:hypothetical protein
MPSTKNIKMRIYKTIILPVVLYGCEIWSLILREEYRLRVFKNRVLRRIFGPKRDEVTGCWRKLHNKELHTLHSSPSVITKNTHALIDARKEFCPEVNTKKLSIFFCLVTRMQGKS